MQFIVTTGEGNRLILHAQTSRTYELICAVEDEDSLFSALKRFCGKFYSKLQMERYVWNYQSDSTRRGIIYKEYNRQLKEQWETIFAPLYKDRIEKVLAKEFKPARFVVSGYKKKCAEELLKMLS